MLIKLIVIGKLKDKAMQARCAEYLKWLGKYAKVELKELPDSTVAQEGQAILKELEKERHAYTFVMSEEGGQYTSEGFSHKVAGLDCKAVFVIGGPYGLAPEVKACANEIWSLSKLTFTHELARLLLCEQLYRAMSIANGGQYHNP